MADRRSTSTVRATLAEGIAYAAKSHEYLEAAEDALARGNHVATVGNAVHATIAAADAVSAVRLKSRWKSDHSGAADHVAAAGGEGEQCAASLRRVLPLKHQAEYDPVPMAPAKARTAIRAASQAVAAADRVLVQAQAPPAR
ncbi:MAG: hypothetical protein ACRDY0_03295 [Acidimicrobiales bacterium]